ncbi:MAG: deoxyguanosinetriphosphate triphosphohydrolase, partial [Pseudomonadota bacterium]
MAELAPYASNPHASRGRFVADPDAAGRSPFQRDRDRIIHSAAFRRLKHKTQVFVYHEGDHYRTRLTHSLEVAQVARSMARALRLDEDLTEALSLAHDLGHTPFGHAGERELDKCMAEHGGFDHNAQALRIVTRLERRYAGFDGLNLTWETLEGLVKHNGPVVDAHGQPAGRYAKLGLPHAIVEFAQNHDLHLDRYASAEAQIAAISDDIAYNAHDIDDGLRAGLFEVTALLDVPIAGRAIREVQEMWPDLDRHRLIHETVRRVISWMIFDVIAQTEANVAANDVDSADAVRKTQTAIVGFSPQMKQDNAGLQAFLAAHMYRHDKVIAIMDRARRVVRDLFEAYSRDPGQLPADWQEHGYSRGDSRQARQI